MQIEDADLSAFAVNIAIGMLNFNPDSSRKAYNPIPTDPTIYSFYV
jgi:cyanate lyase